MLGSKYAVRHLYKRLVRKLRQSGCACTLAQPLVFTNYNQIASFGSAVRLGSLATDNSGIAEYCPESFAACRLSLRTGCRVNVFANGNVSVFKLSSMEVLPPTLQELASLVQPYLLSSS
eukprot:m.45806 g.45806  ORF g.45806 m.45806 type:complete len:119 (-) comp13106_c0_seq7:110-466(-)